MRTNFDELLIQLDNLAMDVTDINVANGWHEDDRSVGDECALLHSEVSETLEAFRDGQMEGSIRSDGKPEGFGSECADVLIRLLDTCDRRGIELAIEVQRKLEYNVTRGYRHGGKAV